MEKKKDLRVGIIGTGWIAEKAAFTLQRQEGLICQAVGSRTQEKADAFAKEWGIAKAHGSYSDLIADPEVDLVYVGTPHSHHFDVTMEALEQGKPCLVEKAFMANHAQSKKVVDLARIVSQYSGAIRLHVVNFTEIQLYIYEQCPHDELTIIMRRYMMKIAERLAQKNGCLSLVTGESIGQVASQTMQAMAVTNAVCSLPVFRPLVAFDKQEIVDISEKIGTYETSIEPYEDCCTIFVAKHPVTKPLLHKIEKSELALAEKIDEMVERAVETEEIISVW